VVNQVVRNTVVWRLANPDSNGTLKQFAAVVNPAVGDFVGQRLFRRFLANRCLADLDSTGAKVGELALRNAIRLTAARQFQTVRAEMREHALLKLTGANALAPNRTRHAHRRLTEPGRFRRQTPLRV